MKFIRHWHVARILDVDKNRRRTLRPLSRGYRTRATASFHRRDYPGVVTGIVQCFGPCQLAFLPDPGQWMDSEVGHVELSAESAFY